MYEQAPVEMCPFLKPEVFEGEGVSMII